MKANITNLRKALKASADAHNVKFHYWRNDGQMALESEAVPVVADVRMICEAFYGFSAMVEANYGYTTIWLGSEFEKEVGEGLLALALPYGTQLN